MSRMWKWCGFGSAALCSVMAMTAVPATADDVRVSVKPAVVRTTDDSTAQVPVQQTGWRRGWAGPGYYYRGGYYGPAAGAYVGPGYYGRPYYGPRYARPYAGYGYAYPAYGAYGYAW